MIINVVLFCLGFFIGVVFYDCAVASGALWRRKPKVQRKLARDCETCRHVIYAGRAEYCACPEREPHYHSLGYGVLAPCTDERCPEKDDGR